MAHARDRRVDDRLDVSAHVVAGVGHVAAGKDTSLGHLDQKAPRMWASRPASCLCVVNTLSSAYKIRSIEFRMPHTYEYPRPALTVDCVVFGIDDSDLKVLLIQRDLEPFAGSWALPGGFVHIDESLTEAAQRELQEETGLDRVFLEQLYTYGDVGRDPRGRVVSVAYYALVRLSDHKVQAATDARDASWFAVSNTPSLAFDHEGILQAALERLKGKVRYQPIGFELLPKKFTLSQLQGLYATVLERELDRRNFRKKILSMDILDELDEVEKDVAHRAARLYRFNERKYKKLIKAGFDFQI